uniref:Uncharacterized protein n=1 Tax=Hyaloperonospora arabidopsidis (strain Emoy2) TaxID=559515 RepID=M4BWA3_HYAAE
MLSVYILPRPCASSYTVYLNVCLVRAVRQIILVFARLIAKTYRLLRGSTEKEQYINASFHGSSYISANDQSRIYPTHRFYNLQQT